MAVRAKRWPKHKDTEIKPTVVAADIVKPEHPLNSAFVNWLGDHKATRRKARLFLSENPYYRYQKEI
jgi:hypothetical protein